MKTGAGPAPPRAPQRQGAPATPIRAVAEEDTARAQLLRRLATDRLRDLRDDGVTLAYMARMYGVEQELMEEMVSALGLGTR